jgi:hypothetical protein
MAIVVSVFVKLNKCIDYKDSRYCRLHSAIFATYNTRVLINRHKMADAQSVVLVTCPSGRGFSEDLREA